MATCKTKKTYQTMLQKCMSHWKKQTKCFILTQQFSIAHDEKECYGTLHKSVSPKTETNIFYIKIS